MLARRQRPFLGQHVGENRKRSYPRLAATGILQQVSQKGTAQSKRDYFNKCVANGGNMDDHVPKQEK
jgi:hypothetical protein